MLTFCPVGGRCLVLCAEVHVRLPALWSPRDHGLSSKGVGPHAAGPSAGLCPQGSQSVQAGGRDSHGLCRHTDDGPGTVPLRGVVRAPAEAAPGGGRGLQAACGAVCGGSVSPIKI